MSATTIRIFLHRPPIWSLVVLVLAILVSSLPEPAPDATGVAPSALVLPLCLLALVLALPRLRQSMSMERAWRDGNRRSAKVSEIIVHTDDGNRFRGQFTWSDANGRRGTSLPIRRRWCPPKGSSVTVYQDTARGIQWWEGDYPGSHAEIPKSATAGPNVPAPVSLVLTYPYFAAAVFGAVISALLAVAGTPMLILLPVLAATLVCVWLTVQFRAQLSRAFGGGPRLSARVDAHDNTFRDRSRQVYLRWSTRQGHRGLTSSVPAKGAPAKGSTIHIRVDPVTGNGWWEGEAS